MVFLHKQQNPSRKRPSSSFVSPFPAQKLAKTTTAAADGSQNSSVESSTEKMAEILAEAGCTILDPSGPPCVPSDPNKLRRHLQRLLSGVRRSDFLAGLATYIQSSRNLCRILAPAKRDGISTPSESLIRHLLLIPSIQLDVQTMLLEKLPEHFDSCLADQSSSLLDGDVARLIVNHFRWLDFMVEPVTFTEKLMQTLSICPLHLKKEIIGSLPEIISNETNGTVVESLERMLLEDSEIVIVALDTFSNLNLDDSLQEQVVTIALSCIRTIDVEHMPFLLRFLLLSATPANAGRIISQIREHLKFVGSSHIRARQQRTLKGKSSVDSSEALILDALRSSLQFKNMLCQEILKELSSLQKSRDHKVIDIWLLILIYMNGESLQKRVEKILKKKIIEGCIQESMFDQCISGLKELVKDYFPTFISLSEYLLACKEQKAREFGICVHTSLFKEFTDSYSRQEVLGSLVTLVGSGVSYVVSSALETMGLLASNHLHELVPLSPHITGVLEYLEGFSIKNLHKVYEVFSHLALFARSNGDSYRSSFANELLMIVRKQVGHTNLKFKKMGLIGTLKIVSCLGDPHNSASQSLSQKSNCEEALELLKMSLECCKQLPLSLVMFYDELAELIESKTLHPTIIEWVVKHVGEFEYNFLSDLDGGRLPTKESYCGLEGELWMNLDGDISPICLKILPLVSSSLQSTSLQALPANFLLLAATERLTNRGSLGGIDALLGCPLHLPSSKYFYGAGWESLTGKQKQVLCLSLYYAQNWIRELLNAFSTQIAGGFEFTSQATKEDIAAKLQNRLRNLVFLESLLNYTLGRCNQSLPELHISTDHSGSAMLNQTHYVRHVEKTTDQNKLNDTNTSDKKRTRKKLSEACTSSDPNEKLKQPTVFDVLKKAGAISSQDVPINSSALSSKARSQSSEQHHSDFNEPSTIEISAVSKALDTQRSKFRSLLVQCFSMLSISRSQDTCCSDPAAELLLSLYLLRELRYKLDYFSLPGKQFPGRALGAPIGFTKMEAAQFMIKITSVFPSFKQHLTTALCLFKEGDETCQEHWSTQSTAAGNPNIPIFSLGKSSVSTFISKEIFHCFRKMINLPHILINKATLFSLLEAFKPAKIPEDFFSGVSLKVSPGTVEYLYFGAYSFVESVLNEACSLSFMLASESLFTLESIVALLQNFIDKCTEDEKGNLQVCLAILRKKLGKSAEKLLKHRWESENLENGWKSTGEMVQKILCIYLENSGSTACLLGEIAKSVFSQAFSVNTVEEEDNYDFPTLNSATFTVWYRILHEKNLTVITRLVKEVILLGKCKDNVQRETVEEILIDLQHSVNVVVSLVTLCKNSDKMTVHAMAVKYGGKYVDSFLKVFDFLRVQFEGHRESIIQMVKELQKATRTIQTLCSEAKGLKHTAITNKIPATKRSMERYIFHVKGLHHTISSGCTFWLGNLKHKNLSGQEVSSQAYRNDYDSTEDPSEDFNENVAAGFASEEDHVE